MVWKSFIETYSSRQFSVSVLSVESSGLEARRDAERTANDKFQYSQLSRVVWKNLEEAKYEADSVFQYSQLSRVVWKFLSQEFSPMLL